MLVAVAPCWLVLELLLCAASWVVAHLHMRPALQRAGPLRLAWGRCVWNGRSMLVKLELLCAASWVVARVHVRPLFFCFAGARPLCLAWCWLHERCVWNGRSMLVVVGTATRCFLGGGPLAYETALLLLCRGPGHLFQKRCQERHLLKIPGCQSHLL